MDKQSQTSGPDNQTRKTLKSQLGEVQTYPPLENSMNPYDPSLKIINKRHIIALPTKQSEIRSTLPKYSAVLGISDNLNEGEKTANGGTLSTASPLPKMLVFVLIGLIIAGCAAFLVFYFIGADTNQSKITSKSSHYNSQSKKTSESVPASSSDQSDNPDNADGVTKQIQNDEKQCLDSATLGC